jgi:3-oxoacyl-[acyl-carrier protein] reductase
MNYKVAVITGASKGLGKYLANYFYQNNFSLYLVSRNKKKLEMLKKHLSKKNKQEIHIYNCDLEDQNFIKNLIINFKSKFSKIDVLINNAAIQGPIGLISNNFSFWEKTFKINLYAPILLSYSFANLMKKNSGGSIINISGGGATKPRPNFNAYATSKAALVRMSETLAEELRKFNIRINCIAPGAMPTDMLKEIIKFSSKVGKAEVHSARKTFSEINLSMKKTCELALFLSSKNAKFITGKLISSIWDNWENFAKYSNELNNTDVYTLRRIVGLDRGFFWGDK